MHMGCTCMLRAPIRIIRSPHARICCAPAGSNRKGAGANRKGAGANRKGARSNHKEPLSQG